METVVRTLNNNFEKRENKIKEKLSEALINQPRREHVSMTRKKPLTLFLIDRLNYSF